MADGLSEDQITEIKECFTLFDKDNDGFINPQELGTVMRALGQSPSEAEIEMLTKSYDEGGNQTIDFSEMLSIMTTRMKPKDPMTELQEAFKVFDKDGKGYIDSKHFRHLMTTMGEVMSNAEIEELIQEADKDGEGKIHYEEFVMTVTSK
ncbi:uncharacterized protein [Mytilus edulis]|uniref:uncharacterized protein n=1 Tax=Mytilus edulis TaxID=6550 RepID=UPI0039EE78BF